LLAKLLTHSSFKTTSAWQQFSKTYSASVYINCFSWGGYLLGPRPRRRNCCTWPIFLQDAILYGHGLTRNPEKWVTWI